MSWGIEFAGDAETVKEQLVTQDAWMVHYHNDCSEWQAISAAGKALCDRVIAGNAKLSASDTDNGYRFGVYFKSNGHVHAGQTGESGVLEMRVIMTKMPQPKL